MIRPVKKYTIATVITEARMRHVMVLRIARALRRLEVFIIIPFPANFAVLGGMTAFRSSQKAEVNLSLPFQIILYRQNIFQPLPLRLLYGNIPEGTVNDSHSFSSGSPFSRQAMI